MNAFTTIFVATLACLLTGCEQRNQAGITSGRLDEVLIAEIRDNGGQQVKPPEALSSQVSTWSYRRDQFGTVLETHDIDFAQVDQFVRRAYGEPSKAGKTPEHSQQWVVSAKTAGVAIWYSALEKGVRITILKAVN